MGRRIAGAVCFRLRNAKTPGWRFATAYLALLLIGSLLAACTKEASPETGSIAVQDQQLSAFEEIVVSFGSTPGGIEPHSASLLVVTSVDVICGWAYGTTTDYGRVASHTDMGGVGHKSHNPILTGLQPDTVYHYRFGAVGPDRTMYRSKDLTFKTPPTDTGASEQ